MKQPQASAQQLDMLKMTCIPLELGHINLKKTSARSKLACHSVRSQEVLSGACLLPQYFNQN